VNLPLSRVLFTFNVTLLRLNQPVVVIFRSLIVIMVLLQDTVSFITRLLPGVGEQVLVLFAVLNVSGS